MKPYMYIQNNNNNIAATTKIKLKQNLDYQSSIIIL
jgi:hypothetical protein